MSDRKSRPALEDEGPSNRTIGFVAGFMIGGIAAVIASASFQSVHGAGALHIFLQRTGFLCALVTGITGMIGGWIVKEGLRGVVIGIAVGVAIVIAVAATVVMQE